MRKVHCPLPSFKKEIFAPLLTTPFLVCDDERSQNDNGKQ